MQLYDKLNQQVNQFKAGVNQLPNHRILLLDQLANYIKEQSTEGSTINLNFICTHNSRRSHISQIWAATFAHYFDINGIHTFSGGTEATAFNPRAVGGLRSIGFTIENPGGDNPHYVVSFAPGADPLICYSKTFDAPGNPTKNFGAIMTCSDADENCPFIPGVNFRLPLTYEDPKVADGTPQEASVYNERILQIGQELFYAFTQAKQLLDNR